MTFLEISESIIPNKAFAKALGISEAKFYYKYKNDSFTQDEKAKIKEVVRTFPPLIPNVPIIEKYLRDNNISIKTALERTDLSYGQWYQFVDFPITEDIQKRIVEKIDKSERVDFLDFRDITANKKVRQKLNEEKISLAQFRKAFLNSSESKKYSYRGYFLDLEYTEDFQNELIEFIEGMKADD